MILKLVKKKKKSNLSVSVSWLKSSGGSLKLQLDNLMQFLSNTAPQCADNVQMYTWVE